MNEEKFKFLAELVLLNDSRLCKLTAYVRSLNHLCLQKFGDDQRLLAMMHDFEHLELMEEQAVEARARAREYLGLPPQNEAGGNDSN